MERFDVSDEAALQRARADHADAALALELLAAAPVSAGQIVSPARLHAYAGRRREAVDLAIERQLRLNADMRALYRRFIGELSRYYTPAAMAAGTTEVPPRSGAGWRMTAERSQAEPDQFILVIELDDAQAAAPEVLILCDRNQAFHYVEVPPARRGIIQMILDQEAEPIRLLRDPRTEAYLR